MDKATSRSQHITITASSGLNDSEVERMRKEAEAHADEDLKRKELIEARNHADNLIYTTEKTLKDYGDKIPADKKSAAEEAAKKLRETMQANDLEAIKRDSDHLGELLQQLGASMYQQPGAAGPGDMGGGPAGDAGSGPAAGPAGDDVVDGEFRSA